MAALLGYKEDFSVGQLDFVATTVDIFTKGTPHITQTRFQPKTILKGPLGNFYSSFEVQRDEAVADRLVYKTAGMPEFIEPILEGKASDDDPAVKKYQAALKSNTGNNLTLDELAALAHRLLTVTSNKTLCVGGPDQIAILPSNGKPVWTLKDATNIYDQILGSNFAVGVTFEAGRPNKAEGQVIPDRIAAYNQWAYVMVDNWIRNSTVWLDGNLFVGNLFTNPVFVWNGNEFHFLPHENKIEGSCTIQVGPKAMDKPIPVEFTDCKREIADTSKPLLGVVGYPIPIRVVRLSDQLKKERK